MRVAECLEQNAWSRMLGAECFLEQNAWIRLLFGADLYRIFIAFTTSDEQEAGVAKVLDQSDSTRAAAVQSMPSDAK